MPGRHGRVRVHRLEFHSRPARPLSRAGGRQHRQAHLRGQSRKTWRTSRAIRGIEFEQGDICDREFVRGVLKSRQARRRRQFCRRKPRRSQHSRFGPLYPNQRGRHAGALGLLPRRRTCRGFVQVSTDEVYGSLGAEGFFTEETPLAPNSPYSASKAAADVLVRAYLSHVRLSGRHHALFEQLRSLPVSGKDHSPVHFAGPRTTSRSPFMEKARTFATGFTCSTIAAGSTPPCGRASPGEVTTLAGTRRSATSISPGCCWSCLENRRR